MAAEADIVETALSVKIYADPAIFILHRHRGMAERAGGLGWISDFYLVWIQLLDRRFFMAQKAHIASFAGLAPANETRVGVGISWMSIMALKGQVMARSADYLAVL